MGASGLAGGAGEDAVEDADRGDGDEPEAGVAVGDEVCERGLAWLVERHEGWRGFEEVEDGCGLLGGVWGEADGLGVFGEDVELAEGEAFEDGGVSSVEGGEVCFVAVEAVAMGRFVGECGVAAPSCGVEVLLCGDEDGGGEEGEACDEEEESGVEVSQEWSGCWSGIGHACFFIGWVRLIAGSSLWASVFGARRLAAAWVEKLSLLVLGS